ncbi:MAG: polysaccharide pyruvyl transferase family protein [Lachnospiraceae bacterium]|nr:polysaccharide pyruvyl transferase family protein [Lachnospiraceae bacterium]
MKVGILTFHRADNYGAVLQAYALYSQCVSMKCDVEIIDYCCNAIENSYLPIKLPQLRKNMYRWSVDAVNYLRYGQAWNEKKEKFQLFREKITMSPPYTSSSDRCLIEAEYDYIITGSDQIWSADILDNKPDYWYCYKKESMCPVKVISYAASVGSLSRFVENWSDFEHALSKYDALSVREHEVQVFLEEKLHRKIYTVLDPTLLVDKQLWLDLIDCEDIQNDNCLVYYDVAQNELSRKIARTIARQDKYLIVKFNQIKSPTLNTEYLSNAGPIDFLNSIYNAECIVTSSFHATIFSVLFHKKFITVLHPITGERIRSLLSMLGLEDRIMYDCAKNVTEMMNRPIDYVSVDLKLSKLREESIDYLKTALGLCENKEYEF